MTPRKNRGIFAYLLIFVLAVMGVSYVMSKISDSGKKTEYSEIISHFDNYEVSYYTLDLGSGELKLKLRGENQKLTYEVPNINIFLSDTENYRQEYNEMHPDEPLTQDYYKITDNSWLLSIIPTALMLILGIVFIYLMMRQAGGGGKYTNFGKANLKSQANARKATFDDVAGADEEKQELEEIVDFLKHSNKYKEIGAKIPKGVLLVGPPGTGKTLLARAVAGEAGCPFFPISGSDFVEMFVGVGASRVRDLFEQAKKHAPAIIFIDEIDAVGRHRGAGLGGGHDEREQTLNQLLVEMDGFGTNSGIIVIAATNRPDVLDPALLRPGRFDRQITVNRPDAQGREDILKVHSRNKPLGPDVDLKEIAKDTIGFTGADLENLLNEAALLAVRRKKKALTMQEISDATSRVEMGTEKKSHKYSEKAKKLTAYHEAGHAVSSYYIEGHDPVKEISIIPRGMGAGGYTWYTPQEENYNSKADMLDDLISLLGGRVAEALSLNDISTGASNDLQRATSICRDMVSKYGMSDELGPVVYSDDNNEVFLGKDYGHVNNYSEATSARIDEQIEKMMRKAYSQTESILKTHYDKLELVAETLIKNEKISGDEFTQLMENGFIADEKVSENEEVQAEDTEIVDAENVNEDDLSSNDTKD